MAGRSQEQDVFPTNPPLRIDLNNWHGNKKTGPPDASIYGVKFCPFLPQDADPTFALTFQGHILVCRITPSITSKDANFSIIRVIKDTDEVDEVPQEQYCLAWLKDAKTGDPLLIFAGLLPKIHVYNVAIGKIVKSLVGHMGSVQELVPHPTLPGTFASCSVDNQIRLWNLTSKFDDSFCSVICHGGLGHNSTIFSIDFTKNGRYLVSGGRDTWHHLWALPPPEELELLPKDKSKSQRIYYPHFSSNEVRGDAIDCVRFYGDLILTRAVSDAVLLWKIIGFDSADTPPEPPTKQDPTTNTRSAFGSGFTRLMAFKFDDKTDLVYYYRFGIFDGLNAKPILAVGTVTKPQVKLWDLQRLQECKGETGFHGDPFRGIKPHQELNPNIKDASGVRAITWSSDGNWLIASCDRGLIVVWSRKSMGNSVDGNGDVQMLDAD